MQTTLHPQPIWHPTAPADKIPMNIYRAHINRKLAQNLTTSQDLHRWSVTNPQDFWLDLHDYTGIIPKLPSTITQAYDASLSMGKAPKFFEGAVVDYAENVLSGKPLDKLALVQGALKASGVQKGDRVGAIISTSVWSGVVFGDGFDWGWLRLPTVANLPKILFAGTASTLKGKTRSNISKIQNVFNRLSSKPKVILIPLADVQSSLSFPKLETFLSTSNNNSPLQFTRVPYSHSLYILYTSGTTGVPRCLVHAHSTIIQHKKVSYLHNSLGPDDVVFQYSSTSWVLWNIMIGHLSAGPTLVIYDGSPLWPSPKAFLKILEFHKVTYWDVSPRYLQELEMTGCIPKNEADLSALKMVQTGGSHLEKDQYYWFYRTFPTKIHLTSVTGGTDLVTSWIGTDPAGPVYPGEIQLPMLGQDVDIADPITGEIVKDSGKQGGSSAGNRSPRCRKFPGFWAQHDWASYNPLTRGGRFMDEGIRFGSSDIYSVVEGSPFNNFLFNTLRVGRRRPSDTDESVFLFVVIQSPHKITDTFRESLKDAIRKGLSNKHVPRFVIEVDEVPMTVNGKKVETLVRGIISRGKLPEKVSNTVSDPGCLGAFQKFFGLEVQGRKV
ncbi:hypothetical protein SI65_02386 [Aspergillus cristatus]|uniref:AMP-dependent synthetase/ligase domain-containing protein n=1 Tax=Aspergillus cristatus TaxID=573508 RepID=A0A1E3BKM8_ASPCR|nr:hypothetical protein SI65_02386 [Aspergillus cristatus]